MPVWDPWAFAEAEGIRVFWRRLPPPLRGLYVAPGGEVPHVPHVLLDDSLDEVAARCVLAEELGHHVLQGHLYPIRALLDPQHRLQYTVAETRAMRWALDRLLPLARFENELARAGSSAELAERFRVTEDLVVVRARELNRRQAAARTA